jgi:thioredoxin 2
MSALVNLVCPHCDAVSRVRRVDGARCDRCESPIFAGRSVSLDDPIRLQKHIVSNDVPVLVTFRAPWCGPCRVTAPEFEKAARRLEPDIGLAKVNTDEAPGLGERYGVQAIPTMILFSRGREIARFSGSIQPADIIRFALRHVDAEAEALEPA